MTDQGAFADLLRLHGERKRDIEDRLGQFRTLWERGTEEELFLELVFCLLTPQSRARTCWGAVGELRSNGLLLHGDAARLSAQLGCVRFRNNKARYIVGARERFAPDGRIRVRPALESFEDPEEAREWLVESVKGMGYKEASHFLRNIGLGEYLAILDRHILKSLEKFGVINDIPKTLGRRRYLELEGKMRAFSKKVDIPMGHVDLLFWLKGTGEIFK